MALKASSYGSNIQGWGIIKSMVGCSRTQPTPPEQPPVLSDTVVASHLSDAITLNKIPGHIPKIAGADLRRSYLSKVGPLCDMALGQGQEVVVVPQTAGMLPHIIFLIVLNTCFLNVALFQAGIANL